MTISFKQPSYTFWAEATSHELYMMDLQDLHGHIFSASHATTVAFLKWFPTAYTATPALIEQAANKLIMMEAPIRYSNEDFDRRQDIRSWVMDNVPARMWVDFRNHVAWLRRAAECKAEEMAV
jgi:hypothetical protein